MNLNLKKELKGTVILSKEGINGSVCSDIEFISKFINLISKNISSEIIKNINFSNSSPFPKFKVKIKNEIVKLGLNSEVYKKKGKYIQPYDWDAFCSKKNTIILDIRNGFESEIGHFNNSILPNIKNFSEFPCWAKKNWDIIRNKKVLTYCTGGIRCEKASSFLISEGALEVYQLKGGILRYFAKNLVNKQKFTGECFVFDDRVTVNRKLNKGKYSFCFACGLPITKNDFLSKNYENGVSCPKCISLTSDKQKKRFRERKKQISLSKKRKLV